MIDLGQMDINGSLYASDPQTSPSGAVTYTRTFLGQLYLSRVNIPVITVLVAAKDTEQTDAIFLTRWFDGLKNGMIISCEDGNEYRVTRREELGRREGWRIYGRAVT